MFAPVRLAIELAVGSAVRGVAMDVKGAGERFRPKPGFPGDCFPKPVDVTCHLI
jgi:hypothetical protein